MRNTEIGKLNIIHDIDDIEGLCIIEPKVFLDERGSLVETYNQEEYRKENLTYSFIQDNADDASGNGSAADAGSVCTGGRAGSEGHRNRNGFTVLEETSIRSRRLFLEL